MNDRIRELLVSIPLRTRLEVDTQLAFIDLLTELGYRKGMWTEEEEYILDKLCKLAEKHAITLIDTIERWKEDGSPM